jgi:hypothetical protein
MQIEFLTGVNEFEKLSGNHSSDKEMIGRKGLFGADSIFDFSNKVRDKKIRALFTLLRRLMFLSRPQVSLKMLSSGITIHNS